MSDLELIQNTPSDVLVKKHLKVVFTTYQKLFGEVCTGCPHRISGYINRIKKFKKTDIMSKDKSNFTLGGQSVIVVPGTSQVYSNANLTDEVAIAFIRKNPNRRALFSKVPSNLAQLIEGESEDGVKTLNDHTVKELKAIYPDAKGEKKADLIKDIQSIINQAAVNAEQEEKERILKAGSEEEE